jgi:hypothetical protein
MLDEGQFESKKRHGKKWTEGIRTNQNWTLKVCGVKEEITACQVSKRKIL